MSDFLPPWARAIQQTYYYQVLKAAMWAGLTAGITASIEPASHPNGWLIVAVVAFLSNLQSGLEHSPKSVAFLPDGQPDKVVQQVAEVTKAAVVKADLPSVVAVNQIESITELALDKPKGRMDA